MFGKYLVHKNLDLYSLTLLLLSGNTRAMIGTFILYYPLLFQTGTTGWQFGNHLIDCSATLDDI